MKTSRPNVNKFWYFVKQQYPDARFDFCDSVGELKFVPDGAAESAGGTPYSCVLMDDMLVILKEA